MSKTLKTLFIVAASIGLFATFYDIAYALWNTKPISVLVAAVIFTQVFLEWIKDFFPLDKKA